MPLPAELKKYNGFCVCLKLSGIAATGGSKDPENWTITAKGTFTIYVYNFSHIFDHPPTFVYNFYAINVYKFSRFLTTQRT